MIKTRQDLKEYLEADAKVYDSYINSQFKSTLLLKLTSNHIIQLKKYVRLLRYSSYHKNNFKNNHRLSIIPYIIYTRRLNRLGNRLGLYVSPNADIGKGLIIYHHGGIIINGNATIGDYCSIHGNCCIGNKVTDKGVPVIGNNVDIGWGASIIGNISIGNHVIIGSGSVVTHSFGDKMIIAGVPATDITTKCTT